MRLNISSQTNTSAARRWFLGAAAIIVLAVIAYIPALKAGYVWDDDYNLTENLLIKDPGGLWKYWFAPPPEVLDYFPLTWSSLWLERRVWGLNNPWGFHLTNIILHAIGAILLWRILRRLLRATGARGAWLTAAIFVAHPVAVASVAWITERKNTLSLVFFAAALLLYLWFEDDRRRWRYVLALVCFLLGLLAKNSVAALPPLLLLCAWWQRDRVTLNDVKRSIPFFILAIAAGILGLVFQFYRAQAGETVRHADFLARLLGAGAAIWFYVGKLIWPFNLLTINPYWEISARSILWYLPLSALLIAGIACWRYRKAWGKAVLFAGGCFIICLGPVLGFLNISFMMYSLVADWWQYLASFGLITLVVCGGAHIISRWGASRRRFASKIVAIILLALMTITWNKASEYRDSGALWRANIRNNPGAWMAHYCLGNYIAQQNRIIQIAAEKRANERDGDIYSETIINYDQAIGLYNMALLLNPDYGEAYINRGNACDAAGDYYGALEDYKSAIEVNERLSLKALMNYGIVCMRMGNYGQAIQSFGEVIQKSAAEKAESAQPYWRRGEALLRLAKHVEAVNDLNRAIELEPALQPAYLLRGEALSRLGQPAKGLVDFNMAIRLNRDDGDVWLKRSYCRYQLRDFSGAWDDLRQAMELNAAVPEEYTQMLKNVLERAQ